MPALKKTFSSEWESNWSDIDFAWLAGIFEADGWISKTKGGKGSRKWYAYVGVTMADSLIIRKIGRMFEKEVRVQKPTRTSNLNSTKNLLRVSIAGEKAEVLFRRMKPFLVGSKKSMSSIP